MTKHSTVMSSRNLFAFLFILPSLGVSTVSHGHRVAAVALGITCSHDIMQNEKQNSDVVGVVAKEHFLLLYISYEHKAGKMGWEIGIDIYTLLCVK